MNSFRAFLLSAAVAVIALAAAPAAQAQVPEINFDIKGEGQQDSLGVALETTFQKDYDVVFKAARLGLEKVGYTVNYSSKKRNLMETDFKVIADEETFHDTMAVYGKIPFMRSPGWTIGRNRVSVNFVRNDSTNSTTVKVLAVNSGYEARFSNMWHYWKSNGVLEKMVMDAITSAVVSVETP
jgi:hypothetical protein